MLLNVLGPVPGLIHDAGEEEKNYILQRHLSHACHFLTLYLTASPFPRLDDAVLPPAPPAILSLASLLQQEASITLFREGPALTFPGEESALTFSREGSALTFPQELAHHQEKPDKEDEKP